MNENMKDYLTLIQEPIGRMSTASSVFKGFTATVVTGTAALSFAKIDTIVLVLLVFPVIAFASLDIYYLRVEKAYRGLYMDVLNGSHPIDFSMSIPKDKEFIKRAGMSIGHCIQSPSIWLFYPGMILILLIICFLKYRGGM